MLTLTGCDAILTGRYGYNVEFKTASAAPSAGQLCSESVRDTGSVDPSGRVVRCGWVSGAWRWSAVTELRHPKPLVVVYGDSIAEETAGQLSATLGDGVAVVYRVLGGTAPCDHVAGVVRDMRAYKPDVVYTSFIGNNLTPCTGGATGDALKANYMQALTSIGSAAKAHGAKVVFSTSPPAANSTFVARFTAVRDATAAAARAMPGFGVSVFVSYDGQVLADPANSGRGLMRLPCLSGEAGVCVNGTVQVRSSDGAHLCPSDAPRPGVGLCAARSPGAERYGRAIAQTLRAVFSSSPLPRPVI
jgi:hypothetical protein